MCNFTIENGVSASLPELDHKTDLPLLICRRPAFRHGSLGGCMVRNRILVTCHSRSVKLHCATGSVYYTNEQIRDVLVALTNLALKSGASL